MDHSSCKIWPYAGNPEYLILLDYLIISNNISVQAIRRKDLGKEIIQLREKLNKGKGRKRKYSLQYYLNSLPENPQRLYARPRVFRKER